MADTRDPVRLEAPTSTNTIHIRMIDTTSKMYLHSQTFIEPVMERHRNMNATDMAFLLENKRLGQKVVFDLGVRKDFWNLPPVLRDRLDSVAMGIRVDQDVPEILQAAGVKLSEINDIIMSHPHWDHTGDPSLFPSSTNIVYHADVKSKLPGYPIDPESRLPSTNFSGRQNVAITFDNPAATIGGFRAHDYYNDGSLYLLSTPGHSTGDLSALVRTTPDTFILLAADACHFCGDMRPNHSYPLPEHPSVEGDDKFTTAADLLQRHPQFPAGPPRDRDEAQQRSTQHWYRLSQHPHCAYDDPDTSQETADKIRRFFDSASNVFVALAHDCTLPQMLPTLNHDPHDDLDAWLEKGYKDKCHWGWIRQLDTDECLVRGYWKDGTRYDSMDELLQHVEQERNSKTLDT